MSEGEIKIDVKDRQINCQVCFEDKIIECFYTFRCGHSVCKDCYKKMKDKERCFYCRQEIQDEKMVEKYKKSLWIMNLMMLFDMFYVAFLFIITGESSKKLVILFCVDEVYSMLILMAMILNGFESVSTIYNILTCIVKSVWIIMMFVVKIEWWKGVLFILTKVALIILIMNFEKHRGRLRQYFYGVALER